MRVRFTLALLALVAVFPSTANAASLSVSASPDRSAPAALTGQQLAGNQYVFTDTGPASFYLDNVLVRTENYAPFDLASTASDGTARALNVDTLVAGTHNVGATIGGATLTGTFTTAGSPPPPPGGSFYYDPLAIINQPIPTGFPSDSANSTWTGKLLSNLRASRVLALDHGEVPPVNVASSSDPARQVDIGPVHTQFRVPPGVKLGGGSDHPTIILDPNASPVSPFERYRGLRIWQASCNSPCTTLRGSNASLDHWNSDGAVLNPDGSRSLCKPYVGTAAGNRAGYLCGLITDDDVRSGAINHILRFATSSGIISSRYRPPAYGSDQGTSSGMDMGQTFELSDSVDCSTRTAPGRSVTALESRFVQQLCLALQRFGAMVSDGTGGSTAFYMEDDGTAHWGPLIGTECGTGGYGWTIRSLGYAPGASGSCAPARASDGIPWGSLRALARPASYTSW